MQDDASKRLPVRPATVEVGQLWEWLTTRIYVVVEKHRERNEVFDRALLLDLERGEERIVSTAHMVHGFKNAWALYEP